MKRSCLTHKNIRQGTIPVTDGEGQLVPREFIINQLNPASTSSTTDSSPPGACLRWAIAMDEEKAPRFEIQGLPTASSNINKKYFSGDNAVSVLLGSFPLNADFFDGSFASGFVPIFFSENPTAAQNFLNKNPDVAKEAIQAINSRMLHMEHLTMDEAVAYIQARRGRMAKGSAAFPLPAASRKRGRPTNQGISGSGTDHTQIFRR